MFLIILILISINAYAGKPLILPLNDSYDIALKDANQFKIMFYGYIVGFAVWFAKALYDMTIKKQDTTASKLDKVLEAIAHMEEKINNIENNFVERSEIRMTIRDEIKYANELRAKE